MLFSNINLFSAVEQNTRLGKVATAQEMVREINSLKLGKVIENLHFEEKSVKEIEIIAFGETKPNFYLWLPELVTLCTVMCRKNRHFC